jgi:uncharacterized metal-binding protein YceD (DUF177 family)
MKRDTTKKNGDENRGENRGAERAADRGPWRVSVPVVQIPDGGLHREIEADETTRAALAEAANLREIFAVRAAFDLTPRSGDRVQVRGRVQARVGQTCVVTLEPIENDIDEEVDLIFAPAEQISELAEPAESDGDHEMVDSPEPIENGMIDLGRLATDVLYLAIDPYPRKQDAEFVPEVEAADPEDHPFAALKALKGAPAPSTGKPKGK